MDHAFLSRDHQSRITGLALHLTADQQPEIGVHRFHPGTSTFTLPTDMLCYFIAGRGVFRRNTGETIAIEPGTVVHFKQGWDGNAEITETADATYMRFVGGSSDTTPVLRNPLTASPLKEWGEVSKPLVGKSRTAGILLSKEPDGHAETGIWTCSPGTWRCVVKRDEFCHFIAGSSTYTHDNGEVIEIQPDTLAYFPQGWAGQCEVHETVRKVYVIR